MATKQGRVYFCRPCDTRHESPTNAKCTRRQEPPGEQSPNDDPPPQETRARARPSRPKRSRAKSPPTYESVEGPTSKKQRGSDNTDSDNLFIYLFIYCHLYSAFSIVQCSNALYRL